MQHVADSDRLEVAVFPVRQLVLASETAFDQGTLAIDKAALLQAIAEPHAIREIDIQVTHPGESCRIVHVLDAVASMVKVQGRSTAYPGFFGTTIPAGHGRNHRLHYMARWCVARFRSLPVGRSLHTRPLSI